MHAEGTSDSSSIRVGQVVLPCEEFGPTLEFFVEQLGFRLDGISPADDPRTALISGYGLRIELRRGLAEPPGRLRLLCENPAACGGDAAQLTAPNGTCIEFGSVSPPVRVPPGRQELVVSRGGEGATWVSGRAGMRYRDLIPGRLGGRFIASHIRIDAGGPVPDYVHFHAIRFQMIHCVAGWVRLVYEDQGPPFVLEAGSCVLQPPRIRHRVLECSPGLEVLEIACPAEHDTLADHDLALPTATRRPERDFGGQRFVRHSARATAWQPLRWAGFVAQETGIAEATGGLAGARVVRVTGSGASRPWRHDGEFLFLYVLEGGAMFASGRGEPVRLQTGDSVAVPAGHESSLTDCSPDLQVLEVRLPAADKDVGE